MLALATGASIGLGIDCMGFYHGGIILHPRLARSPSLAEDSPSLAVAATSIRPYD